MYMHLIIGTDALPARAYLLCGRFITAGKSKLCLCVHFQCASYLCAFLLVSETLELLSNGATIPRNQIEAHAS